MEGIRRARAALESADIILNVIDTSGEAEKPDFEEAQINLFNKIDLLDSNAREALLEGLPRHESRAVLISASTGEGLEDLKAAVLEMVGAEATQEGSYSARQRHIDALKRVGAHLRGGRTQFLESQAGELLAEELRLAQNALGEITGEVTVDDLLGEIFASFCIGK